MGRLRDWCDLGRNLPGRILDLWLEVEMEVESSFSADIKTLFTSASTESISNPVVSSVALVVVVFFAV
jgi:hypothetical protein